MKDGGAGDEKLLFQAEVTANRLSMPRLHYNYTFATSVEAQNTRAQRVLLYKSVVDRTLAVAKPKMQHH